MKNVCVCGYGSTPTEKSNMSRHLKVCKVKNDELTLLKTEVSTLEKKLYDMENGIEVQRLKDENNRLKDEMLELQKKLLEKPNVKNVNVNNYGDNNYVLNIVAFGNEPQLDEENVRQMIRDSMSQCGEIIPKFLKRKHFSQESTRNIRFNTSADKIETVQRDAKGKLRWKKERKPPQKFCKDLALAAVTELNELYGAERNPMWKSFNRLRYGENVHEDFKKSQPHPEVKLAIDVQKMIASESSYVNDDDDDDDEEEE